MSLKNLTLGERMVMAARLLAAEHLRQEADDAGINVRRLQNEMNVIRMSEPAAATKARVARTIRQDLFKQPADVADGSEAA